MADEEIDAELLALQAELSGLTEVKGKTEAVEAPKTGGGGDAGGNKGVGVGPLPARGNVEGELVVAAKPAVSLRNASQPEWQQALYKKDYQRMQMRQSDSKGRSHRERDGKREERNEVYPSAPSMPDHQPQPRPQPQAQVQVYGPVGPVAPEVTVNPPPAKKKKIMRTAAGKLWEDPTLEQWPDNDYRIFVGDLAGDATDEILTTAFQKYGSFQMARVIRDKRTHKCKGYGFVSFGTPEDMVKALKEMNGKYVGNRPVKLRKSDWKDRTMSRDKKDEVRLLRDLNRNYFK